jgi:hypothetical protein
VEESNIEFLEAKCLYQEGSKMEFQEARSKMLVRVRKQNETKMVMKNNVEREQLDPMIRIYFFKMFSEFTIRR